MNILKTLEKKFLRTKWAKRQNLDLFPVKSMAEFTPLNYIIIFQFRKKFNEFIVHSFFSITFSPLECDEIRRKLYLSINYVRY